MVANVPFQSVYLVKGKFETYTLGQIIIFKNPIAELFSGFIGNELILKCTFSRERAKIPKYQFEPTIPINSDGLVVNFSLNIIQNVNQTLDISGETNLYDHASLMLSVNEKNGRLICQNKAIVYDGTFSFGKLSVNGKGFESGDYTAKVTVSIPDIQPKEFQNKAGKEYENLIGPYVSRNGSGPTLKYKREFSVGIE